VHFTQSPSHSRRQLPPAAPLPSTLQTLACRIRPLEYLEWCRSHIGPRFTVYPVDMPPLVFLSDPKDIRAVVTAPLTVLHAGAGAARTAPLFGASSFLLLEEDEYLCRRNAIRPAFHRRVVQEHSDMVAELAAHAVSSWPLEDPIESHPRLCAVTLAVILNTVFGSEGPVVAALHDRLLGMLSVTASAVLQEPRLRHLPGWRAAWRRFVRERDEVNKLIARLVADRRSVAREDGDLLDMLLLFRRPDGAALSDGELRDNLVSVIVAGHETTASTLAWAFQLIAHHPAVQDRLIAEIDAGHSDRYLTATISEVVRHRPVFAFAAPRAVAQPIEISGWTYHRPAHLLGCTYLMHHDPELFVDPQDFRPERFLDAHAPPRTWLPWGAGHKLCPGRHLALLELQTILRATLSTRRLLPASEKIEGTRWRSALLTPQEGSKIVLRKRDAGTSHRKRRPPHNAASKASLGRSQPRAV
jgi:cytochrome P450 family 135